MDYIQKYQKYKLKYLKIKKQIGGIIDINLLTNKASDFPKDVHYNKSIELTDVPIEIPNLNISSDKYQMDYYSIADIENSPQYSWTHTGHKIFFCKDTYNKNYGQRLGYKLTDTDSIMLLMNYSYEHKFTTPEYSVEPYEYIPTIKFLSDEPIKIFYNIFSNSIYEDIIDILIINWFCEKISTNNMYPKSSYNKTNIEIHRNHNNIRVSRIIVTQPRITIASSQSLFPPLPIKIHIMTDLIYLFWILETIFNNLENFKYKGIYSFQVMKITGLFHRFTVVEDMVDSYPVIYENNYIHNGTTYKKEPIYNANIVFYVNAIYLDRDQPMIVHLIKTLCELFPDTLNLNTENKYPRFNFKINNNVFIGLGNGDAKEFYANENFLPPQEYTDLFNSTPYDKSDDYYQQINESSKFYSNTELFIKQDGMWVKNNIRSIDKLVPIRGFSQIDSIDKLYKYIGREDLLEKYPLQHSHIDPPVTAVPTPLIAVPTSTSSTVDSVDVDCVNVNCDNVDCVGTTGEQRMRNLDSKCNCCSISG